jgi:hypothetical protein
MGFLVIWTTKLERRDEDRERGCVTAFPGMHSHSSMLPTFLYLVVSGCESSQSRKIIMTARPPKLAVQIK